MLGMRISSTKCKEIRWLSLSLLEKVVYELKSIEHWLLIQKLSTIIEGKGTVGMAVQAISLSLAFLLRDLRPPCVNLAHGAWMNIMVSVSSHHLVAIASSSFVTTTVLVDFASHSVSARLNETVKSCCFHSAKHFSRSYVLRWLLSLFS